jgi:hypothetical protein
VFGIIRSRLIGTGLGPFGNRREKNERYVSIVCSRGTAESPLSYLGVRGSMSAGVGALVDVRRFRSREGSQSVCHVGDRRLFDSPC